VRARTSNRRAAEAKAISILVQAITSAIDDYAERETGNREYFWNTPHKAG
jgi:hypothetical protein